MITHGASVLTSAQARGHMLCDVCEHRFNKCGEEWVVENCWQDSTHFPLREAVIAESPFVAEPGFRAFACRDSRGVDVEKLGYFAASVFWRGSLHGWRIGRNRLTRLDLGPYQSDFQRFLLGQAAFPSAALLVVTLSELQDDLHNRAMSLPRGGERTEAGRHFQFVVPGMTFSMIVGRSIPHQMRQLDTVSNGYIYVSDEADQKKLKGMVSATAEAPRRGKLARMVGSDLRLKA